MFIGTALVVLVLVGLVLFFYRPTRVALERAEAFRFRRMLVTRLGEQDAYRFFYVTNRLLGADDGPLEERFGNKREGVLKFGFFDTVIEPSLGLGMIINPTDWFQNEEIQLEQVQSLDKSEFIAKLRRQVQSSPLQSILINVNGFRGTSIRRCWFSTGRATRGRHRAGTGGRKGLPESQGLNLPRLWG
jgi:hypothetical protein